MRHMIKGLVAAFAVMTAGAAPAFACGYGGCCGGVVSPCATTYVAPAYTYQPTNVYNSTPAYSGCGGCNIATAWSYEHLAEPETQYYYVNQGPTFSGPGMFAPYPTYQENALPAYGYGYRRYGYAQRRHWRQEGYYPGQPLLRRYY